VEAWLKCKYMREHLGEEFGGVVSSVTSFGIFVTLDAMYVEGLVHITELGGDYFKFDEARQELRGERSGIRYAIGSRVRVQVSRVDLDGRRIDFRLVNEGEIAVPRGPGERSGGKKSAKASEKPARERRGSEEAAPAPSRRQHEAAASKDFGGSSGSSGSGGKSKQKASLLTKAPSGKAKGRGTRH